MTQRTARQQQDDDLRSYAPWFYAAAVYNLVWGTLVVLFPAALFAALDIERPDSLPIWQVVGMFVLVYAPAYWWAARRPDRFPHIILIGMLGKLLGPIGFVFSAVFSDFPATFGLTILTNDLIWYPSFIGYLRKAARRAGGWNRLLSGED